MRLQTNDRVPTAFLTAVFAAALLFGSANGQNQNDRKNNPYSPSPGQRTKNDPSLQTAKQPAPSEPAFIMQPAPISGNDNHPTIAQRTFKIAKEANLRALPPTEIYKVGVGDVLFINLKNATRGSGYHTVRQDGTIDFPLAGEDLIVADQTLDAIEEMLASRIALYPDPQLEIKVREYGSHKITVLGLVEDPGEKSLQREAIPLYVIRAQAIVSPKATKAVITRAPLLKLETYDLRNANSDNVLIYPGNKIEFAADANARSGVYFISGEVASPGQKDLIDGLTLYQAITASGGGKNSPRKAVVRRKNESGVFAVLSYDLRAIKDGKAADPTLTAGDVIEVRN